MRKIPYHVYAAVTTTCWAFSNALTGIAMESFSTFSLAFWRYAIAAVCMAAVIAAKRLKQPRVKDVPMFFACGGLGFFLYTICFNLGCRDTTAAVSSTIIAAVPLLTAAAARVFLKEKLAGLQWIGIFTAFTGVVLLVFEPESLSFAPGTLWLLAAALFLSAYNLLQRKLTVNYSALQTSAYSILCGFILLTVFSPGAVRQVSGTGVKVWICVGIMGVFSSAVAYVCWAKAFCIAPSASSVSNYMFLTPFVAAILGFFLSGEVLDGKIAAGGAVILTGLLIFQRGTTRRN